MVMAFVILVSGIYLVIYALVMNTRDMWSAIVMRAIPGLIGVGLMINGAKHLGLIWATKSQQNRPPRRQQ